MFSHVFCAAAPLFPTFFPFFPGFFPRRYRCSSRSSLPPPPYPIDSSLPLAPPSPPRLPPVVRLYPSFFPPLLFSCHVPHPPPCHQSPFFLIGILEFPSLGFFLPHVPQYDPKPQLYLLFLFHFGLFFLRVSPVGLYPLSSVDHLVSPAGLPFDHLL